MANLLRRVKLLVRRDWYTVDAEIDAETAGRFGDSRRRNSDRNMQVEAPLTVNQFSGTRLVRAQLFAHPGRHLQLAGQAAFRTDSQTGGVAVVTQNHRPGVVSDGRMRLESVKLVRFAGISVGHLGDRIDHVLGGQIRFFADQMITRVMDVVFTMQVLLKGHLGKSVAGAVELFHRRLEFLFHFGCDNQFGLYRKVNAHVSNIS